MKVKSLLFYYTPNNENKIKQMCFMSCFLKIELILFLQILAI